jgi:hypothetical protein
MTATPAVVACQNVTFEPVTTTDGDTTTLTINIHNASGRSLRDLDLLIRALKNDDEHDPSTSASASIYAAAPDDGFGKIDYRYNAGSLSNRDMYVQATYRSAGEPVTSDDSFRVRFSVAGMNCAVSGAFPPAPTGGGQPITITFVNPSSDGQVYVRRAQAAIETIVQSGGGDNGDGIAWVSFTIVDEATNKVVWDWIEYYVSYCAFGTANMRCNPPPRAWWAGIADGHYRVEVVARAADGGSAFATRRFQVIHPTPTPLPPTDTPTDTPLPLTDTSTPTPLTDMPTDTPTDTPLPLTDTSTPTSLPPTDTPTDTPLPPTDTPTPLPLTDTSTPTPLTDMPTDTPVITNTPTEIPAGVFSVSFRRAWRTF